MEYVDGGYELTPGIDVYTAWWGFQVYLSEVYSRTYAGLHLALAALISAGFAIVAGFASIIALGYMEQNHIRLALQYEWSGRLTDRWTW